MSRMFTRMIITLQRLSKQKGQGLTEFVLILAFCVAIGWAASEIGFLDAIGAVFDSSKQPESVTAAIGGGKGTSGGTTPTDSTEPTEPTEPTVPTVPPTTAGVGLSGFDWGVLDPNTYFEKPYEDKNVSLDGGKTHVHFKTPEDSQEDRLTADRKALENIARHFIGMTKKDVQDLLTGPNAWTKKDGELVFKGYQSADMSMNTEILLGHFVPGGNNKGMVFLADAWLNASEAENIFKWMKPDKEEYDPTYMYLVSDYAVSQNWITDLTAGNNQKNGLRMWLEYDYSDKDAPFDSPESVKVIGVNIGIDPKSQDNEAIGTDYKEGNKIQYNRLSSAGLNVQVRTDSDGKLYVTHEDTGRKFKMIQNANNGKWELKVVEYNGDGELEVGSGSNSMYNWFRDGDDNVVRKYFADNSTHVSSHDNLDGVVTKEFKVGNIIQLCNEKMKDGVVTGYEYKHYVALTEGTFTVNSENINTLVSSGNFVQIKNYRRENQKTSLKNDGTWNKTTMNKGDLMITDKGEIYMYINKKGKSYAGVDDTDYILLKGKSQAIIG